jgi:hypothetical protein
MNASGSTIQTNASHAVSTAIIAPIIMMVPQGGVELRGSAHARQRHVASVFVKK